VSENDLTLLNVVKEQGGIRGLMDKLKEEKLRSLEEKHGLNEIIRKLEYELHKINN
jgi:hypothetical protein